MIIYKNIRLDIFQIISRPTYYQPMVLVNGINQHYTEFDCQVGTTRNNAPNPHLSLIKLP